MTKQNTLTLTCAVLLEFRVVISELVMQMKELLIFTRTSVQEGVTREDL
jgi:hypothetical protein